MAGDQRRFQIAMMHADRFSQEGKWADATKAYRFAMAEFPNSEAAIIGFGKAALAMNQLKPARKAFEQVLRVNPTHLESLAFIADIHEREGQLDAAAETYLKIGNIQASLDDVESAIDSWTRATRLASGQVNAHLRIADALAQQGKVRPAAREYLTLAAMYQRRGDKEQARKHLKAAQHLLPDDEGIAAAFAMLNSGDTIQPHIIRDTPSESQPAAAGSFEESDDFFDEEDLFALDDFDETERPSGGLLERTQQNALEEMANLIFEDGENPGALVLTQALDWQRSENFDEAIHHFQQAIQRGAAYPAVFYNLGLLYRRQGQLKAAAEMLSRAAEHPKYRTGGLLALGLVQQAAGQFELAAQALIEALRTIDLQTVSGQRSYALAQAYDRLAANYSNGGVETDKLSKFTTALQRFFANPDWEQRVYEARQRMNKVAEEGSVMSLAEFLETPETEIVITTLALTGEYIKSDMLMTASEECLRAIQKVPHYLPLHSRLADIMLKQNRLEHAIDKYLYIATVYRMRHQPDQAVNVYQKVLKLAPMDVNVRSRLIEMYQSLGQPVPALEQYITLADSYYQLAQVDRSLEKYEEALNLAAVTPEAEKLKNDILLRMADIYNQRFDWAKAAASLESLRKSDPGNPRVLRQLVDLYFKLNKSNQATAVLDQLIRIYQRQNPVAVLELLTELTSYYPKDMNLRQRLAVAYAQNNKIKEAIAEYDALGEMQLENGMRDQAVQTIQAIINLGPNDVEGYRRLLSQISGGAL